MPARKREPPIWKCPLHWQSLSRHARRSQNERHAAHQNRQMLHVGEMSCSGSATEVVGGAQARCAEDSWARSVDSGSRSGQWQSLSARRSLAVEGASTNHIRSAAAFVSELRWVMCDVPVDRRSDGRDSRCVARVGAVPLLTCTSSAWDDAHAKAWVLLLSHG